MTDFVFNDSGVPPVEQAELQAVLTRLAATPVPAVRVEVRRKLSGLGGATVLDVVLYFENTFVPRVVKVDTAAAMRQEYVAYNSVIEPAGTDLCPRIITTTPGVTDELNAHGGEREAIAYEHVAHFVGEAQAPLTTLEDVFEEASRGHEASDAAQRATITVASVLNRLRTMLHAKPEVRDAASLAELGPTLGVDLTLAPDPTSVPGRTVYGAQIIAAGTGRSDAADPPIRIGDHVNVSGRVDAVTAGRLVVRRENATVAVEPPPGWVTVDARGTVDVSGRVVDVRPRTVMRRLRQAIPGLSEKADTIRTPDVVAAHPFTHLAEALVTDRLPIVRAAVHGDLNARNVLLVDSPHGRTPRDRPYLIDYARANTSGHLLTDFTWLELNLMRACGGAPGLADLVRMQRLLTVAAALFPTVADDDRPTDESVTGADQHLVAQLRTTAPGLAAVLPTLLRLRWEAWRSYPVGHRDAWFADYRRHLTIAAHRTVKWPDAQQTPVRLAASAAVACVAAEWHDLASAFRFWPDEDLAAVTTALPASLSSCRLPTLDHAPVRDTTPVLAAVAAEVRRRTTDPARTGSILDAADVADALATVATRLAAAAFRLAPSTSGRTPFIDLSVEPVTGPNPGHRTSATAALAADGINVLVGPPGSGKTTVVHALSDRLLAALTRPDAYQPGHRHRIPVLIPAGDVRNAAAGIADVVASHASLDRVADLLGAGCLHLIVDGVTVAADWPAVLAWVERVRATFPGVPVIVCGRTSPVNPPAGVTVHRLLPPATSQAIGYLTETAALHGLPVHRVRHVLSGDNHLSAELLDSPMFLDMLARHLMPETPAPSVGDLLAGHFADLAATTGGGAQARRSAVAFAARLVDAEAGLAPAGPVAGAADADAADWASAVEVLVARGVLTASTDGPEFTRPVYRDFFAAIDLADRPALMAARTRRLPWRRPLVLAVSRRGQGPTLLTAALAVVRRTDPAFAGKLLAVAHPPPDDLTTAAFAAEQNAVLHDVSGGDAAWRRAAAALLALGRPGITLLCGTVADPNAAVGARLAALTVLTGAGPLHENDVEDLLRDLLDETAEHLHLRMAAVRVAAARGFTRLAVLIADAAGPQAPWPLRRAAYAAFGRLGVALPARTVAGYRRAAADRIGALTTELPTLSATDGIDAARAERLELLTGPLADDLDQLLACRFAFDIADDMRIAIERLTAPALDSDEAVRLLGVSADEALARFADADDRCAAAAAHRFLEVAPDRAHELVLSVRPGHSPVKLLAAAAAGHPGGLPRVEALARSVLTAPRGPNENEALAALVQATTLLDPLRGWRLADHVHTALTDADDPARLCWPVRTALARSVPRPGRWDDLFAGRQPLLGVAALAADGFHLDAGSPPAQRLGRDALRILATSVAAAASGPPWQAVDVVRAAATARLVDALKLIRDLLERPALDTMARQLAYRGYGVLTVTALSEVLSAGGFLARFALLDAMSPPDTARMASVVAERIEGYQPLHPSTAAGRLIALGYLGDPGPLLRSLDRAEPRLHVAAQHATLDLAADGPRSPDMWRDPHRAIDAVAVLLAGAGSAMARTTLQVILDALNVRTGQLPASGQP